MAQLPVVGVSRPGRTAVASPGGRGVSLAVNAPKPLSGVTIDPGIINPSIRAARGVTNLINQAGEFTAQVGESIGMAEADNQAAEAKRITKEHYATYMETLRTNNNPESYVKGLDNVNTKIDARIKEKFPNINPVAQRRIAEERADLGSAAKIAVERSSNLRRIGNIKADVLSRSDTALRRQDRNSALAELDRGHKLGVLGDEEFVDQVKAVNSKLDYYDVTNRIQGDDVAVLGELQAKTEDGGFKNFTHLEPESRKVLINAAKSVENRVNKKSISEVVNLIDSGRLDVSQKRIDELKEDGTLSGWDLITMRNLQKSKINETAATKKAALKAERDRAKFIKTTRNDALKGFRDGSLNVEDIDDLNIPLAEKEELKRNGERYITATKNSQALVELYDAIDAISIDGDRVPALQELEKQKGKLPAPLVRDLISQVYAQEDEYDSATVGGKFDIREFGFTEEVPRLGARGSVGKAMLRKIYDPVFDQPNPDDALGAYSADRKKLDNFLSDNPEADEAAVREFIIETTKPTVRAWTVSVLNDRGLSAQTGNVALEGSFNKMLKTLTESERTFVESQVARGISKSQVMDFARKQGIVGGKKPPEGIDLKGGKL